MRTPFGRYIRDKRVAACLGCRYVADALNLSHVVRETKKEILDKMININEED